MTHQHNALLNLDTNTLLERISQKEGGEWDSRYKGLTLSSAFQPIISLNHRRVVGQEALLRSHDLRGNIISPLQLFNANENIEDVIELDRLCRLLHGFNYARHPVSNEWLFLNITPEVISHGYRYGSFFSQLLQDATISPSQVVVEVLESQVSDEMQLSESIDYYRQIGCLIAIDDFGAGHSNIDRVLRLEPEIVKLDRSLLANPSPKARRILANLVSLLHEAGCLVVLEGIETLEQTLVAYDVDADLVQGYFFSSPAVEPLRKLPGEFFPQLDGARQQHQQSMDAFQRGMLSPYHLIFDQAIRDYEAGHGFTRATQPLLKADGVQRIYLTDSEGFIVGNNLHPQQAAARQRPQMAPLMDSHAANLGNRHYFRRAMNSAGTTQTTRPYLSTSGGELCITLSRRVEREGRVGVLCCDLALAEQL